MAKISKKLAQAREKVQPNQFYPLHQAIELAKETSYAKMDSSIDLAFNLNLDVRQADQQLRGSIALPHGTGKQIKVLVATDDVKLQKEATEAGADYVFGQVDLTELLSKDKFDFGVMITEPKMMPFLSRYGKTLGTKGLMPNPKTGTVTEQIGKTVVEVKKGKANYRTDKAGIVHTSIGKKSMSTKSLVENAQEIIKKIKQIKPAAVKGVYIKNLTVSASMGPSIKIVIE